MVDAQEVEAQIEDFKKILTLNNEFEATLMEEILKDRNIPYLIHSYHSIPYGGIFQVSKGWGHIESQPRYEEIIVSIYNDLKEKDNIIWD